MIRNPLFSLTRFLLEYLGIRCNHLVPYIRRAQVKVKVKVKVKVNTKLAYPAPRSLSLPLASSSFRVRSLPLTCLLARSRSPLLFAPAR